MTLAQNCVLLLIIFHIRFGSNLHDIPNVSFTTTSNLSPTYVNTRFHQKKKPQKLFSFPYRVSLLSTKTNQYLRDQLSLLTEQFSSVTLSSTDRILREVYMQSLNTFIIEKRNLTELVIEMANYTNLAIMKKLEAIRNLVNISEQSYRRFAETDETTRNATAKFMEVSLTNSFSYFIFLFFLQKYGYLSSKHVKNVTINNTNENASLTTTTTTPMTTTTTESGLLLTVTVDELSTEKSFPTTTEIKKDLSEDTSQTSVEPDSEYK